MASGFNLEDLTLPPCVVVTHHSLWNLDQKQHGTYRRLRLFLDAIAASGRQITIFCATPDAPSDAETSEVEAEIQHKLMALWGIAAAVVAGRSRPMGQESWLLQQMRGIIGYSMGPLRRYLLDDRSLARLYSLFRENPGIVFAHRLPMMDVLAGQLDHRATIFFDLDDLEHVAVARSLCRNNGIRGRLIDLFSLPALFAAERRAISRAKTAFVCSATDREHAAHWFRSNNIADIPNAVSIPERVFFSVDRPTLLFVGTYSYAPNRDAADFFIEEIFPEIRRCQPEAEIHIVGAAVERLRAYRARVEGVRLLGYVNDIAECYATSRIVVCPVRSGSGTRIKLIEAAAHGKPIVTTTVGAEGIEFTDGVHALFADSASAFAERCVRLLSDDDLCRRLGEAAWRLAKEKYDRQLVVHDLAARFFSLHHEAAQ